MLSVSADSERHSCCLTSRDESKATFKSSVAFVEKEVFAQEEVQIVVTGVVSLTSIS